MPINAKQQKKILGDMTRASGIVRYRAIQELSRGVKNNPRVKTE